MRCADPSTNSGLLAMTNNEVSYCNALWDNARAKASGSELMHLRRAEISYRVWKADNFRGEFTWRRFFTQRVESNKQLLADIWDTGLIQHNANPYIDYITIEEADQLGWGIIYLLRPSTWSWRQLGWLETILDILSFQWFYDLFS